MVVCYTGDKEGRAELRRELIHGRSFHVLLTSYEVRVQVMLTLNMLLSEIHLGLSCMGKMPL